MSQAIIVLTDVYVQKGFESKPQVSFKANEGSEYGIVRLKVSHKKPKARGAEKAEYDNYSIEWRNIKSDNKMIEFLGQPGVRVSIMGELTQEEYEGKKFCKVTCDSRNAISIATFGEKSDGAPAGKVSAEVDTDAL